MAQKQGTSRIFVQLLFSHLLGLVPTQFFPPKTFDLIDFGLKLRYIQEIRFQRAGVNRTPPYPRNYASDRNANGKEVVFRSNREKMIESRTLNEH